MTGDESPYFRSSFAKGDSENSGWPQGRDGGFVREVTADGFYHFEYQLLNGAVTSIFRPEYRYKDATITMEGLIEQSSPRASAFGIVFRYIDERNYHVFAVDGVGRYSLWALRDAQWRELRAQDEKWTRHESINPLGQANQLMVTFSANRLIGYVNGQEVVNLQTTETAIMGGSVGIYAASTPNGGVRTHIDSYQVSSAVTSMTGG
jgi:hypothetical protein